MKYITLNFVLLLLFFFSTINQVQCTCVLESDFGFSINCNFKNSGLFRIRNLGGVKTHFGLGFSLGDELGFAESIGNTESGKKRSLDVRGGNNAIGELPASQMPVSSGHNLRQMRPRATISPNHLLQLNTMMPMPVMSSPQGFKKKPQMMTEASSLPLGVPRFKTIPSDTLKVRDEMLSAQSPPYPKFFDNSQLTGAERFINSMANKGVKVEGGAIPIYAERVPNFQALPSSITAARLVQPTKVEYFPEPELPEVDLKGHTVEELAEAANVSVEVIKSAIKVRQQQLLVEKSMKSSTTTKKKFWKPTTAQTKSTAPSELKEEVTTQSTVTKRSTTPYVPKPKKKVSKKPMKNGHKVMNAPKEYYPVGYEKNFDDNFKTRIDLPATSFHCGDQRHFPGLYADQNLGCMVFHVCALTDDGLIMKSFLCPESTLFDQTILKCNWWFYTDCKSSKSLYDSNLPVSKSYQLMKSLAYFNKHYKNSLNATAEIAGNLDSVISETAASSVPVFAAKDQQ